MKALLIDSIEGDVREVEYDGLKDMQRLVGGYISVAFEFPNGDTLFTDDEGLLKDPHSFFFLQPRGDTPLAGNGLLVGQERMDKDGEYLGTDDVRTTVNELERMIRFASREDINEWLKVNGNRPTSSFTYTDENGKQVTEVLSTWNDLLGGGDAP